MHPAPYGRSMVVFGALGLVWAMQIASLLRVGCFAHDDGLAFIALPLVVPAAMAALGCILALVACAPPSRPGALDRRPLVVTVLVPTAGLMVGVVAGIVWWSEMVPGAAVNGLAVGAVALVLLVPLVVTMRHVARPRSLMDATNRLATWSYAGAAACASSVLTLPPWKAYPTCQTEPAQAVAATAVSAVVCALASVMLVLHVRRSRLLLARTPGAVDSFAEATPEVDTGIGGGSSEILSHPPTAYRHAASLLGVIHGDVMAAQSMMRRQARWALVCCMASLGLAACGIALRLS
jgi:hypothetical protein